MIVLSEQHGLYDRPDLYNLIAPKDMTLERFYVETARERGKRERGLVLVCGGREGFLANAFANAGDLSSRNASADQFGQFALN